MRKAPILFITGTDTGIGKTVLTALLLVHLRQNGHHALALKPFCSGSRRDPSLLGALQDWELKLEEINPYYFSQPTAPLAAARAVRKKISLENVLEHVHKVHSRTEWLLVEGVGGLLVPVAPGVSVLDLITRLNAQAIVAARNRLGTINHTLLTVSALTRAGVSQCKVVLFDARVSDESSASNARILKEFLGPTPLFRIPFLGPRTSNPVVIRRSTHGLSRTLRRILQ